MRKRPSRSNRPPTKYGKPGQAGFTTADAPNQGILDAIRLAGSQKAMAHLFGVTQAAVSYWLRRGCSVTMALMIEAKLGVPFRKLRPDVATTLDHCNAEKAAAVESWGTTTR